MNSMAKVTLRIGFYLQNEHYAQMQAYIPRLQAIKIPQLIIQQKSSQSHQKLASPKKGSKKNTKGYQSKSQMSQSKKNQSQQELNQEEEQNPNLMQNEQQDQPEQQDPIVDNEVPVSQKIDSQKDEQNIMQYLQDSSSDDDDLSSSSNLSSVSRSMSGLKPHQKTKRQKGDRDNLMQLPDRRPRKDKQLDQATQLIRRQQKQTKRKQYLKKQVQAQQKATLDKILNETGRKLKLKQQKQSQEEKRRDNRQFNTLGDVPKIITIEDKSGRVIMTHKTGLFPEEMTRAPLIRIRQECSNCRVNLGKYKMTHSAEVACGLECYRRIFIG